jgi:hypothetical protein
MLINNKETLCKLVMNEFEAFTLFFTQVVKAFPL